MAPETTLPNENRASVARNRRTDAMFVCAYLAVIVIVYLVVYESNISEYAQGVLTLALGNFIGYLTAMYNFETGTTRSSLKKDDTITELSKTAAPPAKEPA
mgnify:CR=1 FL=1